MAASLPAESDTGLSAKKIMEEGNLPTFSLKEVRLFRAKQRAPACSHHTLHDSNTAWLVCAGMNQRGFASTQGPSQVSVRCPLREGVAG